MPDVHVHRHRVAADEIDDRDHANNLAYLRWALAAASAHSAAQGWPESAYLELGAGWVVRRHQIRYLRPARVDEELVVRTWVADMQRYTSTRRYRILRCADDELLAHASTEWAFVDIQTGLPKRIPPEVSGAFPVMGDTDPAP